jgi:hypothetical protein
MPVCKNLPGLVRKSIQRDVVEDEDIGDHHGRIIGHSLGQPSPAPDHRHHPGLLGIGHHIGSAGIPITELFDQLADQFHGMPGGSGLFGHYPAQQATDPLLLDFASLDEGFQVVFSAWATIADNDHPGIVQVAIAIFSAGDLAPQKAVAGQSDGFWPGGASFGQCRARKLLHMDPPKIHQIRTVVFLVVANQNGTIHCGPPTENNRETHGAFFLRKSMNLSWGRHDELFCQKGPCRRRPPSSGGSFFPLCRPPGEVSARGCPSHRAEKVWLGFRRRLQHLA